jgi:hypothetical protein
MGKYLFFLFILLFAIIPQSRSQAKFYVGAGPDYIMPQGDMKKFNMESLGTSIIIESRNYCRLWYGLRIDQVAFDKVDSARTTQFTNAFLLSPGLRYSLVGCDRLFGVFMPYIQAMVTISSIGRVDNTNRLGLGASLGAGAAYGFELFSLCWMLDANALYSAPNAVFRAVDRPSLQSINLSLNLSLGL